MEIHSSTLHNVTVIQRIKYISKYLYRIPRQLIIKQLSGMLSKPFYISSIKRALIIAPHPDDEVFGCGGLMAALTEDKRDVFVLFLTRGEAGHRDCCLMNEELLKETRRNLCYSALNTLGTAKSNIFFFSLPDGNLASVKDDTALHHDIKMLIDALKVDTVFYPHPYENSSDHGAATGIVSKSVEDLPLKKYYYCVWIWHRVPIYKIFCLFLQYKNSFRLDISRVVDKKQKAIHEYLESIASCGNPLSGKIPGTFLHAFKWKYELFFETEYVRKGQPYRWEENA